MWFKQMQLFQLSAYKYTLEELNSKLEPLAFIPCMPSMHSSMGWAMPVEDEEIPLFRAVNGYIMLCLQIEERILPATVIRQELDNKIKQIELAECRKIRKQEKLNLKDDIITTLLPRAFTKLTRLYAYVDTKNNYLIIGTVSGKLTEQFISLFKKSFPVEIRPIEFKKISSTMTHWLKHQSYPKSLAVEKACVLQDPQQENRQIRCQNQDLFDASIQALIKDGCEVIQLALTWHDKVKFTLSHDFLLRSVNCADELIDSVKDLEPETKLQQLDADFLIMSDTYNSLFEDLLNALGRVDDTEEKIESLKQAMIA